MWRLVLTVSLLCWSSEGQVTCRDNQDKAVDWFILYKEPKLKTGLEYLYIDSATKWPPPVYENIKDPKGVLANTLRPFFKLIRSMDPKFGFISYSDQPPGCSAKSDFGHSKGVVMVEKDQTGVWLLHSTPQFPFRRNKNKFWPDSGETNAQMFICVTFPYNEFSKIGKHLQSIRAFPFEHDIPDSFHQELQDAANWVQSDTPLNRPTFQELKSSGHQIFRSFAKRQSEKPEVGDLYYTIAKELSSDVYVQYWNCREDDSYCGTDIKVSNVVTKNTPLGTWDTSDHSKWCVAKDQNKHWSCVVDMNRAVTQYKRRGGALCIVQNEQVQQIFLKFVGNSEDCPPKKKRKTNDCRSDMS